MALCAQPTGERPGRGSRFRDSGFTAWGRIEHIRFGPDNRDNRLERISFWPDRRGLAARQVARALRDARAGALDPATLAGKRVPSRASARWRRAVLRCRPPLKEPEDRAYRCAYAKAIAANIRNVGPARS